MEHQAERGRTVKLILKKCDRGNFLAKDFCKTLINRICKSIKMTPLAGPFTGTIKNNENPALNGASAVMIIQESSISIHLWEEGKIATVLVDSCRDFSVGTLLECCKEELCPEDVNILINYTGE